MEEEGERGGREGGKKLERRNECRRKRERGGRKKGSE